VQVDAVRNYESNEGERGLTSVALDERRGPRRRCDIGLELFRCRATSLGLLLRCFFAESPREIACLFPAKTKKRKEPKKRSNRWSKRRTKTHPTRPLFPRRSFNLNKQIIREAAKDDSLWRNLCRRFPGPGGCEPEGDSTWKGLYR
jgi:hypothetical protein